MTTAYGARLLAESGHRVIRIEPTHGDDIRRAAPHMLQRIDLEHGAFHHFLNAGKESTTINPESAEGLRALQSLVRMADCVVVNRPFCQTAPWFLEANTRISVVEIEDISNELCAYARSGLLSVTGHPGQQPMLLGGHSALSAIGLYVAVATSAALLSARISGHGQHVVLSAQDCLTSLVEQALLSYHTTGNVPDRQGGRGGITAVSGAFPCADGFWMISVPHEPKAWAQFLEWIDDPALTDDASLANESARHEKREFILGRVSEWSKKHKKDDLAAGAQKRGVPASPVATVLDLAHDPQLMARGFLKEIDHPRLGKILFPVGATARAKEDALAPAPCLGEHNAAILKELGYTQAVIQALFESGAI